VLVRENREPLANVRVELFDRDQHSADDSLGFLITNKTGEVIFKYTTADFADGIMGSDDGFALGKKRDTIPDLYVVVYDKDERIVIDQREETVENFAATHIVVLIDEALVQQYRLGKP
jgi:hypothetical protein